MNQPNSASCRLRSVSLLLLLKYSTTVITPYSVSYTDPSLVFFRPPDQLQQGPLADRRNRVKERFLQLCWHHISFCRTRLKPLLFPCHRCISLCYSLLTHLLVLPSSWSPSHWREISAFPSLFFSSSRYRAVVLPSQYQLVRVLVLQTPLLLSWSLLFASLCNSWLESFFSSLRLDPVQFMF